MGTYGYAAPEYMATGIFQITTLVMFTFVIPASCGTTQSYAICSQRYSPERNAYFYITMAFYCFHLTSVCLYEGHLTARSDVYSFGVVLLEMLSGRRAIDKNRPSKEHNLVEWARPYLSSKRRIFQVMDARIQGQYSSSDALKAANLAIQCLSTEPKYRPNMEAVVKALEQLHNSNDNDGSKGSRGENPRRVNRSSSNGPKYHRKNVNEVSNGKPASYAGPYISPLRT
jgi:hypothetical protein